MTRRAKILLVTSAVIVAAGSLCIWSRLANPAPNPASLPSVMLLDPAYKIPRQKVSLFDRTVPATASWGWLWKLKQVITGKRKSVDLSAAFLDVSGWDEAWTTNLSLVQPTFAATNGLRIWILDNQKLAALRSDLKQKEHAEILFLPHIITANEGEAQLSSLTSVLINQVPVQAGLSMDVLPQLRHDATDLTMLLNFSEFDTNTISIRTNLAAAARVQVPTNSGLFLLDATPVAPGNKRIGVLLSVKIPPSKK